MKHVLCQPDLASFPLIIDLFTESISSTFKMNGIQDNEELKYEINEKSLWVKKFLESKNNSSLFLVAKNDAIIVGIAGFFPVSKTIRKNIPTLSEKDIEIGSVYIRPHYQRMGITSELLNALLEEMKNKGITEFYLDCGYPTSQVYWKRIFGDPIREFPNYFGEGESYMIWEIMVEEGIRRISKDRR
jgi:GNAT superfamily N-acetyltransferase